MPEHLDRAYALRAVPIALVVLMAFLVGGQFLLEAVGLRVGTFRIAGGIALFLLALTMIFGESKPQREIGEAVSEGLSGAVIPLAIPSIASPGAMLAVVILTDNHRRSLAEQSVTTGLLVAVLALTLVCLVFASWIQRLIGTAGASVVSRVMGLILATVAVDAVLAGPDKMGVLMLDPQAE